MNQLRAFLRFFCVVPQGELLYFVQAQTSFLDHLRLAKIAITLQRILPFFLNHVRVSCWLDDLSVLRNFRYFPPKQEVLHNQHAYMNRVKNTLLCLPLQTTLSFANCPHNVLYNKRTYNHSSGSVVRFLWSLQSESIRQPLNFHSLALLQITGEFLYRIYLNLGFLMLPQIRFRLWIFGKNITKVMILHSFPIKQYAILICPITDWKYRNQEFRINISTLLYINQITNKDLLSSTEILLNIL